LKPNFTKLETTTSVLRRLDSASRFWQWLFSDCISTLAQVTCSGTRTVAVFAFKLSCSYLELMTRFAICLQPEEAFLPFSMVLNLVKPSKKAVL
jgi:hypothetical protein